MKRREKLNHRIHARKTELLKLGLNPATDSRLMALRKQRLGLAIEHRDGRGAVGAIEFAQKELVELRKNPVANAELIKGKKSFIEAIKFSRSGKRALETVRFL